MMILWTVLAVEEQPDHTGLVTVFVDPAIPAWSVDGAMATATMHWHPDGSHADALRLLVVGGSETVAAVYAPGWGGEWHRSPRTDDLTRCCYGLSTAMLQALMREGATPWDALCAMPFVTLLIRHAGGQLDAYRWPDHHWTNLPSRTDLVLQNIIEQQDSLSRIRIVHIFPILRTAMVQGWDATASQWTVLSDLDPDDPFTAFLYGLAPEDVESLLRRAKSWSAAP